MNLQSQTNIAKILIVLWYLVGIAGFMIRPLEPLFQKLTPFGIIAAGAALLYFHHPRNLRSWLIFSGIALAGFLVEVVGVNTQLLFGFYKYGNSLGIKLWNTPLTIGINWLILVYGISALLRPIRGTWYFPFAGALIMVIFDWIMEPVAIATDMWGWAFNEIPHKNYIDWFLVSGFLFLMVRVLKVEINNRIANLLFLMQLIFFLSLNLLFRIS
jgi:putative membrane protein